MGLMKKLTSSLVASSLVLGLVGSAFAAPTADATNAAFERLSHYNIAKGKLRADGTVDPALAETITRAELVTVVVRAFGQDDNAKLLNGAASYNDVATNEWYSGYVALAKKMAESKGITMGYEDGSFKPTKNVSTVEALAFIMKFLGVKPGTGANWAADTVKAAIEAGVITSADAEMYLDAPNSEATRGLAFALADNIFYGYTKLPGGKSIYTAHVDTQAPGVTLDKVEPTTTATSVKISGKAAGDYVALMIGTEKITPNEDGTFSAEVNLNVGENNITVIAKDLAGNEGTATVAVTRTAGNAAKIQATLGAAEVEAGGETDLTIKVLDANDAEVAVPAADIKVTMPEGFGSYAEGKFTAGTKAGAGTITVTYGELTTAVDLKIIAGALAKVEAELPSVAPGTAVKLIAKDAHGNAIEGASFSEDSADAFVEGNVFTATKGGNYAVKATKGETTVEGVVAVFGKIAGLKVTAPATVIANGASKFKVTVAAVDENGNVVTTFKNQVKYDDNLLAATKSRVTAKDGVAEFEFKAPETLADSEIDVIFEYDKVGKGEDADFTNKDYSAAITVQEQVATSIQVEAPKYLTTNNTSTPHYVSVKVLDQVGKPMKDGSWEVTAKVTGPATLEQGRSTKETDVAVGVGGEKVPVYAEDEGDAGDVTVTVSLNGLTSGTASMKAAFAQAAKGIHLVAEDSDPVKVDNPNAQIGTTLEYATFTVEIVDRAGVPNPEAIADLTLTIKDAGKSTFVSLADEDGDPTTWEQIDSDKKAPISITDTDNGKITLLVASTKANTVSLTITDNDKNLTASAAVSSTFKAEAPKYVGFKSDKLFVLRSENGTTSNFSAQLYDIFGNKAAVSGAQVKFDAGSTKGVKLNGEESTTVSTDENGVATVEATLAGYVKEAFDVTVDDGSDEDAYTLTPGDDTLKISDKVSVQVVYAIAKSITATFVDPADETKRLASYVAGSDTLGVGLKLTVKDNHGFGLENLGLEDFSITSDGADADLSLSNLDLDDLGEGNYLITGIDPVNAGTLTLTAKLKTVAADVQTSRSLSVKPGTPNTVGLAEGDTVTIKKGQINELTLQVKDAYGNAVNATQVTKTVAVKMDSTATTAGGGKYADFRTIKGLPLPEKDGLPYLEIKAGTNSVKFQFVTDASSKYTLILTPDGDYPGFDTNPVEITVNDPSDLYSVAIDEATAGVVSVEPGVEKELTIQLVNAKGQLGGAAPEDITVTISAAAGLTVTEGTSVVIAKGKNSVTITVKADAAGEFNLALTPDKTASKQKVTVKVKAAAPEQAPDPENP